MAPLSRQPASPDGEARKLGCPQTGMAVDLADVPVHPLQDGSQEGIDLRSRSFHFDLDPAVAQVGDKSGHLELPGGLKRSVAKSDTLHMADDEDGFVMNFRHGWQRLSPRSDRSNTQTDRASGGAALPE